MSTHEHVHIIFPVTPDEDGWPPLKSEKVDALSLGDGKYELLTSPGFSQAAIGDVVQAEPDRETGELWATRGLTSGLNSALLIILRAEEHRADLTRIAERHATALRQHGLSEALLVLEVPEATDMNALWADLL